MRQLLPDGPGTSLTDDDLAALYTYPEADWLRVNFVSTLDGAATGADGRTGSINTPADNRVFALQRSLCDAVLVGARTAEAEGYEQVEPGADGTAPVLLVASRSGHVPPRVVGLQPGRGGAVLVTCERAGAEAIALARDALGADAVWVLGDDEIDLAGLRARLTAEGRGRVLCEGGPSLHAAALAAGAVDELALTWAPSLVAGAHPRIAHGGESLDVAVVPRVLVEEDGTLLGLWRLDR